MSKHTQFSNISLGVIGMSELLQESKIKQENSQIYDYMWSGLLVEMEELQN